MCRKSIDHYVSFRHPTWRPIYPPDNATWFQNNTQTTESDSDEKCSGNIGGFTTVDEVVDIGKMRQIVLQNLLETKVGKSPDSEWKNWKMRVVPKRVLGYFYWTPVKVDVSKHVWEYIPGENESFEDFMLDWNSRGFQGRPLWEFVITRPSIGQFAGKTVILTKFSHAIGVRNAFVSM